MPGILDLMNGIEAAGDRGRARGQETALARLYSQAVTAPQDQRQGLLAQMGAINPQAAMEADKGFSGMDDRGFEQFSRLSTAYATTRDPNIGRQWARAGVQAGMLPAEVASKDLNNPADLEGSLKAAQAYAQAFGSAANSEMPSDIRSLKYLQDNPDLLKLDRERRQAGSMTPKLIKTANGYSWGVPGHNLTPAYEGGGDTTTPQNVDSILAAANYMREQGVPDANIDSWINAQPGFGGAQPGAGGRAQPYVAPPKPPTQLQVNADARDTERLRLAQEQAVAATESRREADRVKREAAERRQAASAESANQLISAIDSLTKSPGYANLGTVPGDIQANVPFFRNATKDADAQLKNVAGQVALATMNQLKTLSAAGATGFGSLSAPELKLLNNSIATLQSEDISHAQLAASLKVIRDKMAKITQWKPQAEQPAQQQGAQSHAAPNNTDPLGIL